MVLVEQISALLDYMENHQDLALGHCGRTNEGRSKLKRYWIECAQILNSVSVDCPNKTPAEWRTFFNEYKHKTLKKIKTQKSKISETGGGPAKSIILTPLQERLYSILGRDVGEPLEGVRHNPLTNSLSIEIEEQSFRQQPRRRAKSSEYLFKETSKRIKEEFNTSNNVAQDQGTEEDDEDDCALYCKLLAKKLRRLPENTRTVFMYEIDGLFMNHLRNVSTPDPFA